MESFSLYLIPFSLIFKPTDDGVAMSSTDKRIWKKEKNVCLYVSLLLFSWIDDYKSDYGKDP